MADGLVKTAMVIVALSLLTLVVDWGRGHSMPNTTIMALVRTIGLGHPAIVPAGHEAARPWPRPTAVEGRYLPSLPPGNPGLVPLLDTQDHFFDPSVAP